MQRPDLCWAALITIALTTAAFRPLSAQQDIRVGPSVQVSRDLPQDPHFEMLLAADPSNADRLAACSMVFPTDYHTTEVVTYVTLDRGRTWRPTLRTRGENGYPSWDPACAYGPDGTVYVVSENLDSARKSFERIDRSSDGGRTWDPAPTRFKHGERTFLSIDQTNGERHGWIYFYGAGRLCVPGASCRNPRSVFVRASGDGGRTIVEEEQVPASDGNYPIGKGQGVVLSDGTLLAPIGEWLDYYEPDGTRRGVPLFQLGFQTSRPNGVMKVIVSKAGRPNWPPTIEMHEISDWYVRRDWNGSHLPMLAVDASNGPFRDRVYGAWMDQRTGRAEVYFAYSDDAGKTWSTPRIVNDDRRFPREGEGLDALHGMVAVNREGVVAVMWFDRRDHPNNLGWTVRVRASFDGGETFTPSVAVSEPTDPWRTDPMPLGTVGGWSREGSQLQLGIHGFHFNAGHTVGFAADAGGVFHALWVDTRTKVPQLWTAPITVTGSVHRNGAPHLAELVDVTSNVRLMAKNRLWRRTAGVVEADILLQNMSSDTIPGPLKLRVLTLASDLGTTSITNADEGGTAEGAVWDFTSLLEGGILLPGQTTRPKTVRFQVRDLGPLEMNNDAAYTSLAAMRTKILAGGTTDTKPSTSVNSTGLSKP